MTGISIVLLVIVAFFVVPAVFMWLWNLTAPDVFDLRELTYWQSFRLLLIAAMLLGGAHAAVHLP